MQTILLAQVFLLTLCSMVALGNQRTVVVNLPIISIGGEAVGKVEYNLKGEGSIGLEVAIQRETELYTDDEIQERNGDSILAKGRGVILTYSKYANDAMMSGGYFALGLGYKQVEADWRRSPEEDFVPSEVYFDSDGKIIHSVIAKGATGHIRVGYRYVASVLPISIGAYLGVRHFENTIEDREGNRNSLKTPENDLESLSRRLMSSLEPGIEVGMAF